MQTPDPLPETTVVFIHHNGVCGGAELSLLDLIQALKPHGIHPLAALPANSQLADIMNTHGIEVIPLPLSPLRKSLNPIALLGYLFRVISTNLRLVGLIRTHHARLIHANSATACLYCLAAANICRVPLVWHERDLMTHPRIYRFISHFCKTIVVTSEAVQSNLEAQLGRNHDIRRVSNGIDPAKFAQDSKACDTRGPAPTPTAEEPSLQKQRANLPATGRLVLCAAQFVRWKRHHLFLDAAERVAKQIPDCHFLLAADDTLPDEQPYVAELKARVAESPIKKNVIFTGFVADMPDLLRRCDCVVLPSHREPFGRIIIEGMAAGKPVVAIDAGGPAEIITHGENGLLVPPENAEGLADSLIRLLRDADLAKTLGDNGVKHVHKHYTITQTAQQMRAIFEETIGQKP